MNLYKLATSKNMYELLWDRVGKAPVHAVGTTSRESERQSDVYT